MKCFNVLLVLLTGGVNFLCQGICAQSQLAGKVHNLHAAPLPNISVLLLHSKDSSLAKGTTTNAAGGFILKNISTGKYLLVCSGTGYTSNYQEVNMPSPLADLGVIALNEEPSQLKTVTVSAKKPLFEQKIDRLIINVKNSITNAGGTVLEVLEKSPGVIVNRASGAVSLNGKDGVMVMINGKMSYMPQDAVLQMLNGMNAASVERIELITTPPARYDAGGNAGYINIVMVDNPNEGFNGSYSLSMGIGNGTIPKAGVNFNYRKKKINLYGSYNFSREAQEQVFATYRKVINQGGTDEIAIVSNRDPYRTNHDARIGMDIKINAKTVIGALVSGYNNKWSMNALNYSNSFHNNIPDTTITIANDEVNHWKNGLVNLNLARTINPGTTYTINTDLLYYHNQNPTSYLNTYFNSNGNKLFSENTSSGKTTIIKIWASQFDFNKKVNEKTNVQFGGKLSLSRFTNDILVQKLVNNSWWPDPAYTANYSLKENILAAYGSVDKILSARTNIKLGLRYEYTTSNLESETQKNIVDRKYGKLFPTIFISHQLNEKQSFNFSYNKRINRPAFTQLAPFLIFFDPKTFISGNSSLQPGITDAIKIDYLVRKLVFSVSYSYEKNTIARFQGEVDTSSNIQVTTPQNMKSTRLIYVSAGLPVKVTRWWFSQVNAALNWNKLNALYKKEPVEFSQFFYTLSGSESFTLPKKYSIELSGFYQSEAFLFGANKVDAFGSLNVALQKKFSNSALTIGIDNLLNSMKFSTEFSIPEQNFESNAHFIVFYRVYKIAWTHSFGNKILKDKRARSTASEDERKRVE